MLNVPAEGKVRQRESKRTLRLRIAAAADRKLFRLELNANSLLYFPHILFGEMCVRQIVIYLVLYNILNILTGFIKLQFLVRPYYCGSGASCENEFGSFI